MKVQVRFILAALLASALLIGCSSGGSSSRKAPTPDSNDIVATSADVSGFVEKGPVIGGTLNVYSLKGDGTTKLLKTTTTAELGEYGIRGLELDSELYLFEAILDGADIEDEVSGEYYKGRSDEIMHAVVTKAQVKGGIINITPFSYMAYKMTELLGNGVYLPQGADEANKKVAQWVGTDHLIATSQGELKAALTAMAEKVNENESLGATLQQLLDAVKVSEQGVYIDAAYTIDMAEVCTVVSDDCDKSTNFADTKGATTPIWFLDEEPNIAPGDTPVDPDPNPSPLRTYYLDDYPASKADPEVWDAGNYLVTFIDNASKGNFSIITNFGIDDTVAFNVEEDETTFVAIKSFESDITVTLTQQGSNSDIVSEVTLEDVNPFGIAIATLHDFNLLPVGNLRVHGYNDTVYGSNVKHLVSLSAAGGSLDEHAQLSTAFESYILLVDASRASAVEVINFGPDDAIIFEGVSAENISVANKGGDVEFLVNNNGIINSLVLKEISTREDLIYDLESFNELIVGDATIAKK